MPFSFQGAIAIVTAVNLRRKNTNGGGSRHRATAPHPRKDHVHLRIDVPVYHFARVIGSVRTRDVLDMTSAMHVADMADLGVRRVSVGGSLA